MTREKSRTKLGTEKRFDMQVLQKKKSDDPIKEYDKLSSIEDASSSVIVDAQEYIRLKREIEEKKIELESVRRRLEQTNFSSVVTSEGLLSTYERVDLEIDKNILEKLYNDGREEVAKVISKRVVDRTMLKNAIKNDASLKEFTKEKKIKCFKVSI